MGLMFEPNSIILVSQILYFPPCPFEILREFSKIIKQELCDFIIEPSQHRDTQVSQKLESISLSYCLLELRVETISIYS